MGRVELTVGEVRCIVSFFLSFIQSLYSVPCFSSFLFYLSCGVLSSVSKTILLAPTRRRGWDAGNAGCIVSVGIKCRGVAALLCDWEGVYVHTCGGFSGYINHGSISKGTAKNLTPLERWGLGLSFV